MAYSLAGQILTATVSSHFGWFDLPVKPVNLVRLVGLVAMIAGISMINWENN